MILKTRLSKSSVSLLAIAALLAPATAAKAQETDEIIVTARRVEQTLIEVPVAVSAFNENSAVHR